MTLTSEVSEEMTAEMKGKQAKIKKVADTLLNGFTSPITSMLSSKMKPAAIKQTVADNINGQLIRIFDNEDLDKLKMLATVQADVSTKVDAMVAAKEEVEHTRRQSK